MSTYTTLKLTDSQVEALYWAMHVTDESYAGSEVEGAIAARFGKLEEIETKLEKAGWVK